MEALLERVASGFVKGPVKSEVDFKDDDLVRNLEAKISKIKKRVTHDDPDESERFSESDEEDVKFDEESDVEGAFDEDEEHSEASYNGEENENYNDVVDASDFESLDPREQLKLLMRPVKNDKSLYDDDEDETDEDEEDDEAEEEEDYAMGSSKKSLNLDENDEEDDEEDEQSRPKSNFERQQANLRRTIANLEAENIGEREWTLKGEVTARQRPSNSLLEEDLEFEHVSKTVPVITEEVTESIEDIIKKRIKEAAWDDPEPSRKLDSLVEPSAKRAALQLNEEKSKQSLAAIYETEFEKKQAEAEAAQLRSSKSTATDLNVDGPLDEATKASHDAIRKMFGKLCQALDSLSDNKFAPRAYAMADLEIKTIKK